MPHFTLLAVGFEDVTAVQKALAEYDKSKPVQEHVYKTKQQLLYENEKIKRHITTMINLYETDPTAAERKYGKNSNGYIDWLKGFVKDYEDPEYLYKSYSSNYKVDKNGNILSTSNPDAKWDYYDIMSSTTIRSLKKERDNHTKNFKDEQKYAELWDIRVENKPYNPEEWLFELWSTPTRDDLLSRYGTLNAYLEKKRNAYSASHAVLTPDGWFAPIDTSQFDMPITTKTEKENFKEDYYAKFIEPYDDNTTVWLIDCHI